MTAADFLYSLESVLQSRRVAFSRAAAIAFVESCWELIADEAFLVAVTPLTRPQHHMEVNDRPTAARPRLEGIVPHTPPNSRRQSSASAHRPINFATFALRLTRLDPLWPTTRRPSPRLRPRLLHDKVLHLPLDHLPRLPHGLLPFLAPHPDDVQGVACRSQRVA